VNTSRITAEEIMTAHLVTTTPDMHVLDAIERLLAHRVSGLPVVDPLAGFVGRFSERSAITAADLAAVNSPEGTDVALRSVKARSIMSGGFVLQEQEDVFNAVTVLLKNRVSGAPVIGSDGEFIGVFSEASAMRVFIDLCWEQMPSARINAWIDSEPGRLIHEDTGLDEIMERFQETRYRRLMVVHEDRLKGLVTRRDALQAALNAYVTSPGANAPERTIGTDSDSKKVRHWMRTSVPTVTRSTDVLSVAQTFIESGARQLPVIDGDALVGQISRSDLLRAVQRLFPTPAAASQGAQLLYLSSVNRRSPEAVVRN